MSKDTHPILNARIADGSVWRDGGTGELLGTASDGVVVVIDSAGDCQAAERYLQANPTPDRW